jgi:type IV secretory pathway VirJ component
VVLLSPDESADFEFHFANWLNKSSVNAFPDLPELTKIKNLLIIVFYGDKEKGLLINKIPDHVAKIIKVPGDHHYNYEKTI